MRITGSITVRANQQWTLDGTRMVITGNSLKVFTATTVNDWSIIGRFSITGDNNATGTLPGTAAALHITDCNRYYVQALEAIQIRGYGVLVEPGSNTGERGEKGTIHALQAHGCYIGFGAPGFGDGGEYGNVNVPMITRCSLGMEIGAGNINVTGGNVVDNINGISLITGGNHAHGIICGVNINHNGIDVIADGITLGQTFVGCHVYGGIIWFIDSTGVVFKSCTVDADEYRFENSNGCGFVDCTMPGGNPNSISAHYNGTNSFALWQGCRDLLAAPFRGAVGNIVGIAVSNALASTITLTPANLAAVVTVRLDDTGQLSANDSTQLAYDCYSAVTGVYTSAGKGDGHVRVTAQFVVQNNAADSGDYVMALVHSTIGTIYLDRLVTSTTETIFSMTGEFPMNAADTLRFVMTGTVANNVVIQTTAGGTRAYVEGL
jgi:hypothetical protein